MPRCLRGDKVCLLGTNVRGKHLMTLRDAIEGLGISQRAFGEAFGVSEATVSQWCAGARPVRAELAMQIHHTWGIPLWLLNPQVWAVPPEWAQRCARQTPAQQ